MDLVKVGSVVYVTKPLQWMDLIVVDRLADTTTEYVLCMTTRRSRCLVGMLQRGVAE